MWRRRQTPNPPAWQRFKGPTRSTNGIAKRRHAYRTCGRPRIYPHRGNRLWSVSSPLGASRRRNARCSAIAESNFSRQKKSARAFGSEWLINETSLAKILSRRKPIVTGDASDATGYDRAAVSVANATAVPIREPDTIDNGIASERHATTN